MIFVLPRLLVRALLAICSALLGLALCVGLIKLDEALEIVPRLPAYAGEDDFEARAAAFVLLACPAFMLLGANLSLRAPYRALRGWLGALLGSALAFLLARLLSPWLLSRTHEPSNASYAFVGFVIIWIAFALAAAMVATRIRLRTYH